MVLNIQNKYQYKSTLLHFNSASLDTQTQTKVLELTDILKILSVKYFCNIDELIFYI